MTGIALGRCTIHIESGLLERAGSIITSASPAHRYAIVTDETVRGLYADRLVATLPSGRSRIYAFAPGEAHKTRKTWAAITDAMLADGMGRDTTVISLGGGVVGDLAGFIAATFMRGVPLIHVPTTLLAMVDASIGGKTGVDVPAGKNLVGAFHQPLAVITDPDVLSTLPVEELRGGLAEAIKHGVIADAKYFETTIRALDVLRVPSHDRAAMTACIVGSARIKAAIVGQDAREAGLRQTLNFGHTLGHAIEAATSMRTSHGDAIAIGMVGEALIAERMKAAERGTSDAVRDAIARAGLPTRLPRGLEIDAVLDATRSDKKARAGAVRYALPKRIGVMSSDSAGWAMPVSDDVVVAVLREMAEQE